MTITAEKIAQLDETITGTPAALADRGTGAPLPYWQDQPCPSWCMAGPHEDREMPEDRCHMSISLDVTLTLEAADVKALEVRPGQFTAYLDQGWREREARVILSHNGATGIEFTPRRGMRVGSGTGFSR